MDGGGDLDGAIPLGGAVVLGELGLGSHLAGGGGYLAGVARHLHDGPVDPGHELVEAVGNLGQLVLAGETGAAVEGEVAGHFANMGLQEGDPAAQPDEDEGSRRAARWRWR